MSIRKHVDTFFWFSYRETTTDNLTFIFNEVGFFKILKIRKSKFALNSIFLSRKLVLFEGLAPEMFNNVIDELKCQSNNTIL